MTHYRHGLAAIAVLCATTLPAMAESSAASSASESVSASVGSLSTSVKNSSDGSSRATNVAEGDYRVIEVAAVADRPGTVRMTLQPVAEQSEQGGLFLYVPQQVAQAGLLAPGQVVSAHRRAYGVEFAKADDQQAFFLVLDDAWYRELQTRPVTL
ncbi:MAG TPA: hypothetical protein VJ743_02355 [Albitalea sp.]|nr:hypothetical protein [Albitalea sp.]